MNKKVKLVLGVIIFAALIGTAVYRTAPSLSATFQAKVANFEQYRLRTQVVSCINDDLPTVTAIGVHFIENGDLSIVISYIGQNKESVLLSYQRVAKCALLVPGWKQLVIVDVAFQMIETIDDGQTHLIATIYDKMIMPRDWAEDIAGAPDVGRIEMEFRSGLDNKHIQYLNLSYFGFPFTSDLVNGDLDLAIDRIQDAVAAAKKAAEQDN